MNDYFVRVRQAKLCHKDEEGDPRAALFVIPTMHKGFLIPCVTWGFLHPIRFFPQQNPEG
jgi:hypothetical protein